MRRNCSNCTAQAFAEYAILLGIVAAAILGMQLYAKRGIQAGIKMAADQMSPHAKDADGAKAQADGMRYESGERTTAVVAAGTVLDRQSAARTQKTQTVGARTATGGAVERTIVTDRTDTFGALQNGAALHAEVITDVR